MIRKISLVAAMLCAPALAQAEPVVQAVSDFCVLPLHQGAEMGDGLSRAPAEMETKLLNGKLGKIYRTANPQILVVAHDSGQTCEIMALGTDLSAFVAALGDLRIDDGVFASSPDTTFPSDAPGGGYLAAVREAGGFMQIYLTTHPESRFIGATVGRVDDSAMARQVLGLE